MVSIRPRGRQRRCPQVTVVLSTWIVRPVKFEQPQPSIVPAIRPHTAPVVLKEPVWPFVQVTGFAQGVGGGAASGVAETCADAALVPWESVAVTS